MPKLAKQPSSAWLVTKANAIMVLKVRSDSTNDRNLGGEKLTRRARPEPACKVGLSNLSCGCGQCSTSLDIEEKKWYTALTAESFL